MIETVNFEDGLRGYCVYIYEGMYTGTLPDTVVANVWVAYQTQVGNPDLTPSGE